METERKLNLKKLLSNKFVLGLITGFAIGMATKNLAVGIALMVVLSLAWYSASKKTKEPVEDQV